MFGYDSVFLLITVTKYLTFGINYANSLENVASRKPSTQSSTWFYGAGLAVDGYADTYAHGDQEKTTLNWWKVDLEAEYYISEIILTPRQSADVGRMDYVFVGISNSPEISGEVKYPTYPLCRQSPDMVKYKNGVYENILVKCRPNSPPGRYVIIQQPSTSPGYLTIAEIQVFGTKLENNTCKGNYYGDKCDKYCNCDKGVKCDQQGICPNGCDVNWKGDHCDIKKNESSPIIGCFGCSNSTNFQFNRTNSQDCITTCSGYGFTYAANMTSDQCICTNTMNWTKPCQDNKCSSQNCQQFYSVCPSGTYGYNCTLKCNCLNNGRCSYMEGSCEDGCAIGWTGASCYERNCTTGNGGCDETTEVCVSNSSDVTSCQCKKGYNRTSDWLPCLSLPISGTESDSNTPKSAIIGGVIGSIAVLCLIVALILLFIKYRKRLRNTGSISSLFPTKDTNTNQNEPSRHLHLDPSSPKKFKLSDIERFSEENVDSVDEFQKLGHYEKDQLLHTKGYMSNLNRFKNVVPYVHNRVKLLRKPNENQSDYINASYIKGIIDKVLIAAQGPVKSNINDFWKMIWQQNIGIVIMLCNYVERKKIKCENYFSDATNFKAGEYTIQQSKTTSWPSFNLRELKISNGDQKRSLIHLHYTEWPDHGVPNNIFYLLDFWRRCQKLYEREQCGILVHCSAGIGRTGSFLAIYDLLVKGYQGLDISVPETVNNLRKQRMKMVEKQVQYNFIYDALIEEVKLGQTSFSKDEFTKFYNNCGNSNIEKSRSLNQHQVLDQFHSLYPKNDELVTYIKIVTSAYNFSLMVNGSISWQNIPETQCIFIFDPSTESIIVPNNGKPIYSGQVAISLVVEKTSEWGKMIEVQRKGNDVSNYENVVLNDYENVDEFREKNIKMYFVEKKEDYLDFITFMELFSKLPSDGNATVILGNNPNLGYFFVAACNIISQLKVYDEVAILQNLYELCKVTNYQPSEVSFQKLHQIVHEFILTSAF